MGASFDPDHTHNASVVENLVGLYPICNIIGCIMPYGVSIMASSSCFAAEAKGTSQQDVDTGGEGKA